MTEPTNTEQTAPGASSPALPRIEGICLGPYQTNCYVVRPAQGGADETRCWIADFSFDIATLLDPVEQAGLAPEALVLTHAHVDHIAGLAEAKRRFPDAPVLIHRAEKDWLTDANLNLSGYFTFLYHNFYLFLRKSRLWFF